MAQITDHDLADPPKQKQTSEQKKASFFAIIKSLVIFSAFYSLLHKVLVPIALGFFQVSIKEYSQVDVLFIPILLCSFFIFHYPKHLWLLKMFAMSALITAGFDLLSIWLFPPKGWLLISHLVCAVPVLISTSLLLMKSSVSQNQLDLRMVTTSMAFAALVCGAWLYNHSKGQQTMVSLLRDQPQENIDLTQVIKDTSSACGMWQGVLDVWAVSKTVAQEPLQIKACGLWPLWRSLSDEVVELKNFKNHTVNVRVLALRSNEKPKPVLNKIVRAGERVELMPANAKNYEGFAVLSDSHPELGVVFFGFRPSKPSFIKFSRKPLEIHWLYGGSLR